jgi:hypothetical protein
VGAFHCESTPFGKISLDHETMREVT